jgi:hypothetical protein
MKAYEELEARGYLFLTSARDCGVRSSPSLDRRRGESPGIHGLAGWVSQTAVLGGFEKRYNFYLCGQSNHDSLDVQPVTQVMHQLSCPCPVVTTDGEFSLA